MSIAQFKIALQNKNVSAFLHVIRLGESSQDDSAYTVLYGGSHFKGFGDHPRKNFPLPDGRTTSAAGAYQIVRTTWDALVRQYAFPDFTPSSQDCAAVALMAGRRALDDVIAGCIESAIVKCRNEWTSLPGAAESTGRTMAKALAVYVQWGGQLLSKEHQ